MAPGPGAAGTALLLALAPLWTSAVGQYPGPHGNYVVRNRTHDGDGGWRAALVFEGGAVDRPSLGAAISPLELHAGPCGTRGMRLRVTDPADPHRWQVPGVVTEDACVADPPALSQATIEIAADGGEVWAALLADDDAAVVVNVSGLSFRAAFLELSMATTTAAAANSAANATAGFGEGDDLGSSANARTTNATMTRVFGLGERVGPLQLPPLTNITLFSHDQGPPGTSGFPLQNYYGVHPFALLLTPGGIGTGDGGGDGGSHSTGKGNRAAKHPEDSGSRSSSGIGSGGSRRADPGLAARAAGVFLLNSNAMQAEIGTGTAGQPALTLRSTGGIVDLFAFGGPSPEDVVVSYHRVVGRPALPLYASLGYHQCRAGYRSVQQLQEVLTGLNEAAIPTDWVWSDIDHMDQLQDFTLDPARFPPAEMAAFVRALHEQGKRYVLILDPAIHINASYGPYSRLLASRAYMRRPKDDDDDDDDDPFVGRLWAGESIYPDVMSDAGAQWWADEIARFHGGVVAFDGLWVDENEISSLCNQGNPEWSCDAHPRPPPRAANSSSRRRVAAAGPARRPPRGFNPEHPPFVPSTHHGVPELSFGTINVSARHAAEGAAAGGLRARGTAGAGAGALDRRGRGAGGAGELAGAASLRAPTPAASPWRTPYAVAGDTLSYDTHSMYGVAQSAATAAALRALHLGKRPFVLSRSTYPSAGTHAAHWTGDNQSGWLDLLYSIAGALGFQLFGVPLVGADICGFLGNTTAELCTRWFQVAAFLPFARSHNAAAKDQEPYAFDPATTAAIRAVLRSRYALLPYLYSAFARVASGGSGFVVAPLFAAFPDDPGTYAAGVVVGGGGGGGGGSGRAGGGGSQVDDGDDGIPRQWMFGRDLLVSPVLTEGAREVTAYFPRGPRWYAWHSGALVSAAGGARAVLPTPLAAFNLHVRGGAVVATQPLPAGVLSTAGARTAPFELVVAVDAAGAAGGWVYLDDGESAPPPPPPPPQQQRPANSNAAAGTAAAGAAAAGAAATLRRSGVGGGGLSPEHTNATFAASLLRAPAVAAPAPAAQAARGRAAPAATPALRAAAGGPRADATWTLRAGAAAPDAYAGAAAMRVESLRVLGLSSVARRGGLSGDSATAAAAAAAAAADLANGEGVWRVAAVAMNGVALPAAGWDQDEGTGTLRVRGLNASLVKPWALTAQLLWHQS